MHKFDLRRLPCRLHFDRWVTQVVDSWTSGVASHLIYFFYLLSQQINFYFQKVFFRWAIVVLELLLRDLY